LHIEEGKTFESKEKFNKIMLLAQATKVTSYHRPEGSHGTKV